jgi:hypothetical protein
VIGSEHISYNGAPTVGFGETREEGERKFYSTMFGRPLFGLVAGAVAGAIGLGRGVEKGVGAAVVGAVVGGLAGGAVGAMSGAYTMRRAIAAHNAALRATWRRIQATDTVKAGQQVALSIVGPNRAPLTPEEIAQVDEAMALVTTVGSVRAGYDVSRLVAKYPPGSVLPAYWPADDDLGPQAYRVVIDALADAAPNFLQTHRIADVVTVIGWVRSR